MSVLDVTSLDVFLNITKIPQRVGRMAYQGGKSYFEYDSDFLVTGLELSPFKLPLKSGVQICQDHVFEGLFGLFNDSLPDGWGRLLIDRFASKAGILPSSLTPLDRLAYVGERGPGALSYIPDHSTGQFDALSLDLDALNQETHHILTGETSEILEQLIELGESSAGARPKVTVYVAEDKRNLTSRPSTHPSSTAWIIKFMSTFDPQDVGNIEYAYSLMAKDAGLEMSETFLFPSKLGRQFFGTKRFDRGKEKRHVHTASGLLHADYRVCSLDYVDLLKMTRYLTRDVREVDKVYSLAVFNVLAYNRDDHTKNISYLMDPSGNWAVAPFYDLTFSSGPGGEQSMLVAGEGRHPTEEHLMVLAKEAEVDCQKAQTVIQHVKDIVANWKDYAQKASVSKESTSSVQQVLIGG